MELQPLTIEQIAARFEVSEATVRRWVGDGMPCLRPSERTMRFILSDCIDWMRTRGAA